MRKRTLLFVIVLPALALLFLQLGLHQASQAWAAPPASPSQATYLADCTAGVGDVVDLIADINAANAGPGSDTILLGIGCVYTLTTADNYWYGPNGLPAITSTIIISGQGATIVRPSSAPNFRLFYVGGTPTNIPVGTLTLYNMTLEGGLAQGGHGGRGGGGGMGAGGAIYNQGNLHLENVTVAGNTAQGGNGASGPINLAGGGGGGMGANGSSSGGGGGFNPNYGAGSSGGGFLSAGEGGKGGSSGGSGGTSPVGGDGASSSGSIGGGGGGFTVDASGSSAGPGGGNGGSGSGGTGGGGGAFGGGGGIGYRGTDLDSAGGGGGGAGAGGGGGGRAAIVAGGAYGGYGGGGGFGGGGGSAGFGQRGDKIGGSGGFGGGGGGSWDHHASGGFGGGRSGTFVSGIGGGFGGGGGGMGGGVFNHTGQITLINTTIAHNSAQGGNSGGSNSSPGTGYGGAIFNLDGQVTLLNSTLSTNTVAAGSGSSPTAPDGGGIYNRGQSGAVTVFAKNTIMANAVGGNDCAQSAGSGSSTITSQGHNLVESGCGADFGASGDISGLDPLLGPLTNNPAASPEWLMPTMALLSGSPAIDAGDDIGCPATDERGVTRPRDGDGDDTANCDIGAYEKDEALRIYKLASISSADPGDPVSFTITFGNYSQLSTATDVVIVDDIPLHLESPLYASSGALVTRTEGTWYVWQVEDLPPGGGGVITITGILNSGLPTGHILTNRAYVYGTIEGIRLSQSDSATIRVAGVDLAVDKTVDDPEPDPGDVITYTVILANQGPDNATAAMVSDTLPVGISYGGYTATQGLYTAGAWNVGPLAVGQVATLTITGTVDMGTAAQTIINTAAVSTSTPVDNLTSNNVDSAVITVSGADLTVDKTVDNPIPYPGDTFTYTLNVANLGPDSASGVVLSDALPSGVTYAWHSESSGTYTQTTGAWDVGALTAGEIATLTLAATVDWGTAGQTITNTAAISHSNQADSVAGNNADAVIVTVNGSAVPLLQVVKGVGTGGSAQVPLGGVVTYTVVFRNVGTDIASSAIMTDPLPVGVTFGAWVQQSGASLSQQTIEWGPADLIPSETYTITFTADVTSSLHFVGRLLVNTAYLSAVDAGATAGSASFFLAGTSIYLPLVTQDYVVAPDLVVDRIIATSDDMQVVLINQGNAPVEDEFWVDCYVDPAPAPTAVNQIWPDLAAEGLVWGVVTQIQPGDRITLTASGALSGFSYVNWPLTVGTPVYAQVDSANAGTTYGAVLESHEIIGQAYNNIAGPVLSIAP